MPIDRPVLRYIGSKWSIASWIIDHFPPHDAYVEPFFGSGAILFSKERSRSELVNDLDGDVVNLFRVIRDRPAELASVIALTPYSRDELLATIQPAITEGGRQSFETIPVSDELERARRFLVYHWQTRGGAHDRKRPGWRFDLRGAARKSLAGQWAELPARILDVVERLRGVGIENRPALEVIDRASHSKIYGRVNADGVLIYADPPYVNDSRVNRYDRVYRHQMTDDEHLVMLSALELHSGPVLLSGYRSRLYDERLSRWSRVERSSRNQVNAVKTEVLWMNEPAARYATLPLRWEDAHG